MVAGGYEQQRRGVGADPVEGEQPRGVVGDEGDEQLADAVDLVGEKLGASAQLAQRDAGGVADGVARARTQRGCLGHQRGTRVPCEPGPDIVRSGANRGSGLVDRLGSLAAGAALGDHERADRLHHAVATLGCTAGSARLGCSGRADRVERIGLALTPTILTIGAVNLDHPDVGGLDVAGQTGAVAAGSFDPHEVHRADPTPLVAQAGVARRGGGELVDAQQTADPVQRSRDMHIKVGVHAAGDGAALYDGQGHPFLCVGVARACWPTGPANPDL